jgi:hypothetical protein
MRGLLQNNQTRPANNFGTQSVAAMSINLLQQLQHSASGTATAGAPAA